MNNENTEILQMLLSEDDDDVHLALILIMEGKVRVTSMEIHTFYMSRRDMTCRAHLYDKVVEWTKAIDGHLYSHLDQLAKKSQELFTNQ